MAAGVDPTRAAALFASWRADWNKFIREALGVELDAEQQAVVSAVQGSPLVSVRSGTARGKDFVAACAALCFLYLTPRWNARGEMVENTKVALTAPTDRQVKNIMMPEISRLFNRARQRGFILPGRLNAYDIRTDSDEWFLTGFKADEHNHEAWSGFHAVNTMFVVTEATGISDDTFAAIEGNLQGNSRLLLVFNPITLVGYAARSVTDTTRQYQFANMRAYLAWSLREWLDPQAGQGAMLPPDAQFDEEATEVRWSFRSDGKILIEPKDDIKKRIGRNPDKFDALANTFHPLPRSPAADLTAAKPPGGAQQG